MEKYMTDDRSQRARAAAEAGTATRERLIAEAWKAYQHDVSEAKTQMPGDPEEIEPRHVHNCQVALAVAYTHLNELARLIAQRDGYADPRQGMLRELTEGDEPGVALNGWGSKR
jgi:hypothetical protein